MHSRLEILKPCNQDWSKMTSLDQNKFCEKCQKNVIDFTGYKKKEIFKLLNSNENVCGRLDKSQLNENYFLNDNKNYPLTKLTFILSIGSMLGFSEPTNARPNEHKTEIREFNNWNSVLPKNQTKDSIKIQGIVLDQEGLALPGVNVILKGSKIGTQTDFDGNFSISFPNDQVGKENYLIFSYLGFETKEYKIYEKNRYIRIDLTLDNAILGEVVVIQRANIFNKIGYFFSKLFTGKEEKRNCE